MSNRLDDVLRQWPQWPSALGVSQKPKIVRQLDGGLTNQSVLIEAHQKPYVLRLNASNEKELGIDRASEYQIYQGLAASGIVPRCYYYSPCGQYTLFEFIQGRQWSLDDFRCNAQRQRLEALLPQIQACPIKAKYLDYLKHIETYEQRLSLSASGNKAIGSNITAEDQLALTVFKAALKPWQKTWQPVLCHHDLVPQNIIESDKGLVILDWEYAGLSHPSFDQRYIHSQLKPNSDDLQHGDLLDQSIYWLCTLWSRLQALS